MNSNKISSKRNQPVEDYVSFLLGDIEVNEKIDAADNIACNKLTPDKSSLNKTKKNEKKDSFDNVSQDFCPENRGSFLGKKETIVKDIVLKESVVEELSDPRLKKVKQLLAKIPFDLDQNKTILNSEIKLFEKDKPIQETNSELISSQEVNVEQLEKALIETSFTERKFTKLKDILPNDFQTLVFKVDKQPFAVPLLKLGGIVCLKDCQVTPLIGTPDWFLGLVPGERGSLMVIDTQMFLMPETISSDNQTRNQDYKYLIILDNSHWALACHSMTDAKRLTKSDVRWIAKASRRPWFSGMVVDYMSALIEVDELINQLASHIIQE